MFDKEVFKQIIARGVAGEIEEAVRRCETPTEFVRACVVTMQEGITPESNIGGVKLATRAIIQDALGRGAAFLGEAIKASSFPQTYEGLIDARIMISESVFGVLLPLLYTIGFCPHEPSQAFSGAAWNVAFQYEHAIGAPVNFPQMERLSGAFEYACKGITPDFRRLCVDSLQCMMNSVASVRPPFPDITSLDSTARAFSNVVSTLKNIDLQLAGLERQGIGPTTQRDRQLFDLLVASRDHCSTTYTGGGNAPMRDSRALMDCRAGGVSELTDANYLLGQRIRYEDSRPKYIDLGIQCIREFQEKLKARRLEIADRLRSKQRQGPVLGTRQ